MAGSSMTFTYDDGADGGFIRSRVHRVIASWVSDDATGSVSGATRKLAGRLVKAVTVPSGTAAPTDNYDIVLTDEQSLDVLTGVQSTLANRDQTATEQVYFLVLDAAATPLAQSVHPIVCSTVTIAVTNAGNSKAGTIYLYLEQ